MKRCSQCKEFKPLESFTKNKSRSDGIQHTCKKCKNSRQRKYYQQNKDSYNKKTKESRANRNRIAREYVVKYLHQNPCVDCGESDIHVLEFDHVSGDKKSGVGRMIGDGLSLDIIIEEINKCEVRCCNCHRKVTYSRAGIDFTHYI